LKQVLQKIPCDSEIVFVNDGSSDGTARILRGLCLADRRIKMLGFSRNFGHQLAITAGMDFAHGDAVVVMDADLQDPPEILIEMVRLYQDGYDVVSAQRATRDTDTFFKRATAAGFYWVMRKLVDKRLVPQVGDFRLFSRAAIETLTLFREQHRFMRGMVAWCGLKEAIVPFDRQSRAAGTTKYSTLKMLRFAWTAISSFSGMPLRMTLSLGIAFTLAGFLYFLYAAYAALFLKVTVPGWASLVFVEVMFSGAILLAIGVMGDYVARIYEEIKGRPLYILSDSANFDLEAQRVPRAAILPRPASRESTPLPAQPARERWAKGA
jgi:dolichol-phosphate mannosyltransferase